jgi:hypothetical protein
MLMDREIRPACAEAAAQGDCTVSIEQTVYFPPMHVNDSLVNTVRKTTLQLRHECMDMVGGADHDAAYVATGCHRINITVLIGKKFHLKHYEARKSRYFGPLRLLYQNLYLVPKK